MVLGRVDGVDIITLDFGDGEFEIRRHRIFGAVIFEEGVEIAIDNLAVKIFPFLGETRAAQPPRFREAGVELAGMIGQRVMGGLRDCAADVSLFTIHGILSGLKSGGD